jgi:hypothetical protein
MVSGRRLPIGRPRASRPRSGDLAPRRRRGCSVTSCRPRAHAAIARGPSWPWRLGKIGKGAADGIGLSAAQVQGRNAVELASERSCTLTRSCGVLFDLAQIRHEISGCIGPARKWRGHGPRRPVRAYGVRY